jgi:hypothetical protein
MFLRLYELTGETDTGLLDRATKAAEFLLRIQLPSGDFAGMDRMPFLGERACLFARRRMRACVRARARACVFGSGFGSDVGGR